MTTQTTRGPAVLQHLLAYSALTLTAVAFAALAAVLTATLLGAGSSGLFGHGIWPLIIRIPVVTLPLGFLALVALVAYNALRRGRRQSRR